MENIAYGVEENDINLDRVWDSLQAAQLEDLIEELLKWMNSKKADDYRTVGIGAQILSDIGVKVMILLSTPKVYHGINAFGLNVIKY